jgi:hypothetical protein
MQSKRLGEKMPIRITNIGSDLEKPARPERYQLLIVSTGEFKISRQMGEQTPVRTNIHSN